MLSTCLAMLGSRSDTHAPVSPNCFQVRVRGGQRADAAVGRGLEILGERLRQRLAVQLDQLRLVVEQVERPRRAGHVQPDHRLHLGREMRLLRRQRVDEVVSSLGREHAARQPAH